MTIEQQIVNGYRDSAVGALETLRIRLERMNLMEDSDIFEARLHMECALREIGEWERAKEHNPPQSPLISRGEDERALLPSQRDREEFWAEAVL